MTITTTKRNHYVPVFLLRRFTDTDGMLWVYDKAARKWFRTNPINAGVETGMYPQEVEDWFSDEVESPAGPIFEKLSKRDSNLSESEISVIANFISEQMFRVPATRESTSERYDSPGSNELHEQMLEMATELRLLEQHTDFSMSENHHAALQRYVELSKSDPERFRAEIGMDDTYKAMLEARIRSDQPNRTADFLMRLAWRIVYSERERVVLCDNPVFVWNLGGTGGSDSEQFEAVLPISAKCALHIGRYGQGGVVNEVRTDDAMVRRFNSRTVSRAQRFIYSSREERWVNKSAHYKSPRLPHQRFDGQLIQAKYGREPCPNCGREFTQQEWDLAEISYEGKNTEEGFLLAEVRTISHPCLVRG